MILRWSQSSLTDFFKNVFATPEPESDDLAVFSGAKKGRGRRAWQSPARLHSHGHAQSDCQVALGSPTWETFFSSRIGFTLSLFQSLDHEQHVIAKIDLNES
jgi:hypothetical protein